MKTSKLYRAALAASIAGQRANPKMRHLSPEDVVHNAQADASVVMAEHDGAINAGLKEITAQSIARGKRIDELVAENINLRQTLTVERQGATRVTNLLAAVLWSLPGHERRLTAEETKELDGKTYEIREDPLFEGRLTVARIIVSEPAAPPAVPAEPEQKVDA